MGASVLILVCIDSTFPGIIQKRGTIEDRWVNHWLSDSHFIGGTIFG